MVSSQSFTLIFLLICCYRVVISAPLEENAKILTNDYHIDENGNFQFKMLLDNGIGHSAVGTLKEVNGVQVVTVQGEYQFTAPNGQTFIVPYQADENGYVVKQGARPPPTPPPAIPPLPPNLPIKRVNPRTVATLVG